MVDPDFDEPDHVDGLSCSIALRPSIPPTTQTYLDAISKIKAQGGVLPKFNASLLPSGVDARQVVAAYIDGLPDTHANFVNAAAMGGKTVPPLDLSKVPGYTPPSQLQGSPAMQGSIYQDYPIRRTIMQKNSQTCRGDGRASSWGNREGGLRYSRGSRHSGQTALGIAGATAGGTAADELMNKADVMAGLAHPETQLPASMDTTGARVGKEALTNAAMVGGGKLLGGMASELAAPFASLVNPEVTLGG